MMADAAWRWVRCTSVTVPFVATCAGRAAGGHTGHYIGAWSSVAPALHPVLHEPHLAFETRAGVAEQQMKADAQSLVPTQTLILGLQDEVRDLSAAVLHVPAALDTG